MAMERPNICGTCPLVDEEAKGGSVLSSMDFFGLHLICCSWDRVSTGRKVLAEEEHLTGALLLQMLRDDVLVHWSHLALIPLEPGS